jgi:hypothetical protein
MTFNTLILSGCALLYLSGSTLIGKYKGGCHKDEYWSIRLKSDSTFHQYSLISGSGKTETKGTWHVKGDTLIADTKYIDNVPIAIMSQERKEIDPKFMLAEGSRKYIIKKDTLVLLLKLKGHPIRKWCTLTK